MKKSLIAACLFAALAASARAQEPALTTPDAPAPIEGVSASDNPELWVYLDEMRRYDDPKMILRRRAEERAAHRRQRLESQKWYGYSPLRPMATSVPSMGVPAPMWIGNGYHPYYWVNTPVRIYHHHVIDR